MESLLALDQFVEHWEDCPSFLVDPFGNVTFRALVRVRCTASAAGNDHLTVVRIRRHGNDKGRIHIQIQPGSPAKFPHTDFFPSRQQYAYESAEHALMVHGNSHSLGGPYVVAITPG